MTHKKGSIVWDIELKTDTHAQLGRKFQSRSRMMTHTVRDSKKTVSVKILIFDSVDIGKQYFRMCQQISSVNHEI